MRFTVVSVGKPKHKFIKEAAEHYSKRIAHESEIELVEVKESESNPEKEAEALERAWEKLAKSGHTRLVLLDERGKEMASRPFAGWIEKQATSGVSRLVFIVGGAYGLTDSLRQKAHFTLSLSQFTFPHDLARVLVLEQIYRALQIRSGSRYHHD